MEENLYFAPTKSTKDGLWRLRVTSTVEDELGVLAQKTGFLAFRDENKAKKVLDMLNDNTLTPVFGAELQPGISVLTYAKVEAETEVA